MSPAAAHYQRAVELLEQARGIGCTRFAAEDLRELLQEAAVEAQLAEVQLRVAELRYAHGQELGGFEYRGTTGPRDADHSDFGDLTEPVNTSAFSCHSCLDCGQVANTDDQEPWIHWQTLPPGSDLAVRLGLVRPIPCPVCTPRAIDLEASGS